VIGYNPVAVGDESTVVAEFVTEENTDSAYQSEADLEREFIENLQSQYIKQGMIEDASREHSERLPRT